MRELLICIAHHHTPERLQYLRAILKTFESYQVSPDIIIDTNVANLDVKGENITVLSHVSLAHPFHLTWMHRRHIKDRIEDYRWFMYIEDDIQLSFENFTNYQANFEQLWPDFVPSFVRVEKYEGEEFALDITEGRACNLVRSSFSTLSQSYHGFWIMPQPALKETMTADFARLSDSRETAASYPMWELHKTPVVQLDRWQVDPRCFAYHLPNNYAPCPTSPHGKIRVSDIFL